MKPFEIDEFDPLFTLKKYFGQNKEFTGFQEKYRPISDKSVIWETSTCYEVYQLNSAVTGTSKGGGQRTYRSSANEKKFWAKVRTWKRYPKGDYRNMEQKSALRELIIAKELQDVEGEQMVKLVDVFFEVLPASRGCKEVLQASKEEMYIPKDATMLVGVFEYQEGGNLLELLEKSPNEQKWSEIYKGVLERLLWIHKQGLVHSDIKPQNIVLSQSGRPYIIDFETAIRVEDGIRWGSTQFFEAPEMVCQYLGVSMRGVHGVSKITTAADFWSFGISIICSSVLGTNNLRRDLRNGLTSDFFSNEKMRTCNSKLLDLICRLTEYDPTYRATICEHLEFHPWFGANANTGPGEESKARQRFDNEIKMLERNRQKREDEGSRPIYLVIKEEEKPQLGPGHPVRTDYAPKVIWVHNFGDIREWIENILLKRQRKPQIRVSLVNDASDYQSNESAFNLEEMKQKNYDCNAINCVVVTFY